MLTLLLPFCLTGHLPAPLTPVTLDGLTVLVRDLKHSPTLGGLVSTGTAVMYGGEGPVTAKTTLSRSGREVDLTLREAEVAQVVAALEDGFGAAPAVRALLKPYARGKVTKTVVRVRGDRVTLEATGFRSTGDVAREPIQRVTGEADLKARTWAVKLYALRGLIELSGTLPEGK